MLRKKVLDKINKVFYNLLDKIKNNIEKLLKVTEILLYIVSAIIFFMILVVFFVNNDLMNEVILPSLAIAVAIINSLTDIVIKAKNRIFKAKDGTTKIDDRIIKIICNIFLLVLSVVACIIFILPILPAKKIIDISTYEYDGNTLTFEVKTSTSVNNISCQYETSIFTHKNKKTVGCKRIFTYNETIELLPEETHEFIVRISDNSGTVDEKSFSIIVDGPYLIEVNKDMIVDVGIGSDLRFCKTPTPNNTRIGSIPHNSIVYVYGETFEQSPNDKGENITWAKVSWNNMDGWVNKKWLNEISITNINNWMSINVGEGNTLRFCSTVSTADSAEIGSISDGEIVYVYGFTTQEYEDRIWAKIKYNNQNGWVNSEWLRE